VYAVAVTADGRVVSGSADRTIRVWDPVPGRVISYLAEAEVLCVASHPHLPLFVAGLENGRVLLLALEPDATALPALSWS
jgi:WD40 repeat protein